MYSLNQAYFGSHLIVLSISLGKNSIALTFNVVLTCLLELWYLRIHYNGTLVGSRNYGDQYSLQWRHNERDGVSNHLHLDCLLAVCSGTDKKTSKLQVTGLCGGNPPVTGEYSAQRASNAENASIWWRHHVKFFKFFSLSHVSRNSIFISGKYQ